VTGRIRLILLLGLTLVAGGLGHLFGVMRLYLDQGLPDMSRILIDLWVGQAQLAGGGFYVAAARAAGRVPILFMRAPVTFRIPASAYLILSTWILLAIVRSRRE
jgi:hypothetical protein